MELPGDFWSRLFGLTKYWLKSCRVPLSSSIVKSATEAAQRLCYAEFDKISSPLKIKQVTPFIIKLPTISINLFVDQITFPAIYVTSLVVQFIY